MKLLRKRQLTDGLIGSFSILGNVFVYDGLGAFLFNQWLVLFMLRDKLGLQLHDRIFDTRSGKILDFSFWHNWGRIVIASVITSSCCTSWPPVSLVLHAVRH